MRRNTIIIVVIILFAGRRGRGDGEDEFDRPGHGRRGGLLKSEDGGLGGGGGGHGRRHRAREDGRHGRSSGDGGRNQGGEGDGGGRGRGDGGQDDDRRGRDGDGGGEWSIWTDPLGQGSFGEHIGDGGGPEIARVESAARRGARGSRR